MVELGEEMGDVEEEADEVGELVQEELQELFNFPVNTSQPGYNVNENTISIQITVDDEGLGTLEEIFEGVSVSVGGRLQFTFQKSGDN